MSRCSMPWCVVGLAVFVCGCHGVRNDRFMSEARKANGLVIILPGIEGESSMNRNIRRGLLDAGIGSALPIYNWGRPVPIAGVLLNQVDVIGNRIEAGNIARMIVQYQKDYPGRPVYLVGHSGGGGIAVFSAEALPEGSQVDGLVLLSASLSAGYDLTKALERTRGRIVNIYNERDVALLGIGTTLVGNVDRMPGPSAGLEGFKEPGPEASPSKRRAYARLHQIRVGSLAGGGDPHAAATRAPFVRHHVAPWVSGVISPTAARPAHARY